MKATGIVRRIDELGRVVIPKEIRRTQRIRRGDPLEIFTTGDGEVIFKKYSPMGEYFLKITSPSPVVKISSGSPRRMRWVRRISLGITTLPSSSMRRTIPVAFIYSVLLLVSFVCSICQRRQIIPAAHFLLCPPHCVPGGVLLQ